MKRIINDIKNYIIYKKKVRLLKMYAVNQLTKIIVDNDAYVNTFNKLVNYISENPSNLDLEKLVQEISKSNNSK